MHKEDIHVPDSSWGGGIRPCAPCPAVWVIKDDGHAKISEQHQYFLRAANYNMTLRNVYLLLDDALAFANKTGFINIDNPGKKDYFFRRLDFAELPKYDKVRTTSRSLMTGKVEYSLMVALSQTFMAIRRKELRPSLIGESLTSSNVLSVTTLDSRVPPPLKEGRSYPSRVEDANIDDYLYSPRTHPWMFMVANITNREGETVQFPRGAAYPWFDGGRTYVSYVPYTANHAYGPFRLPLSRVVKVTEVVSPYRWNN